MPDDLHEALRARARSEGKTLGEYVLGVLRRDVARPSRRQWERSGCAPATPWRASTPSPSSRPTGGWPAHPGSAYG